MMTFRNPSDDKVYNPYGPQDEYKKFSTLFIPPARFIYGQQTQVRTGQPTEINHK